MKAAASQVTNQTTDTATGQGTGQITSQAISRAINQAADQSSTPLIDGDFQTSASRASVSSYYELSRALADQISLITLTSDIICPDNLVISHDVTIDLGGHSLISDEATFGARLLDVRRGSVHLTGTGKVFAMGERSVAVRAFGAISAGLPDYTTITIDPGVTLFAPDGYGIFISANLGVAYGLTINFAGRILAHDGICLPDTITGRDLNPPVINIADGALITTDELDGIALTALGFGHWQIGRSELRGFTGALLAHGTLDFRDTHIITSAPDRSSAFQLDDPTSDEPDLSATITGGAYVSERSQVIAGNPKTIKTFQIANGEFRGSRRPAAALMKKITPGEANFSTAVASFLAQLPPIMPEAPTPTTISPTPAPEPLSETATAPDLLFATPTSNPDEFISALTADEPAPLAATSSQPDLTTPTTTLPESLPEETLATSKVTESPEPLEPPVTPPTDDLTAARLALSDALAEIRRLDPDDYEVGFTALQAAIHDADLTLAEASSSLIDIHNAASRLLTAFDQLEERTELSLTDRELDELFYQDTLPELTPSASKAPETPIAPSAPAAPTPTPVITPVFAPTFSAPTPVQPSRHVNLTQQSTRPIANTSAPTPANFASPTYASQTTPQLASHSTTQPTSYQTIRPAPRPTSYPAAQPYAPAPLLGSLVPAAMFDNLEPAPIWSLGVTMIDEQTPFLADDLTRRRLQRLSRPRLLAVFGRLADPFRRFARNFSAAFRAGLSTYKTNKRILGRY